MAWLWFIIFIALLLLLSFMYVKSRRSRQLVFIRTYIFHKAIKEKIKKKYPQLDDQQVNLVFRALRDYFWMCRKAKRQSVSMPSQVVDDAWHEFILFTKAYYDFCNKALGRFLHHTPTEAMQTPTIAQEGIKRAWRLACANENINPVTPEKLPLIFAIDSLLQIPDGFTYSLNCRDKNSPGYGYCASHIGCATGCSGSSAVTGGSPGFFDGWFDSAGCASDSGGGGCGGD